MTLLLPPDDPPLTGHVVVFTGRLSRLSRRDASALVHQLGGCATDEVTSKTTLLVVGSAAASNGKGTPGIAMDEADRSRKLKKAEHVNAREGGRVRILGEEEFCALAGLPPPDPLSGQRYSLRDIRSMYPRLREDHLRYLANWGLITPGIRTQTGTHYGFADLVVIRQAHAEIERGVTFRSVLRSLSAAREGQLSLDFRPSHGRSQPAKIIALARSSRAASAGDTGVWLPDDAGVDLGRATEYFLEAFALDDGDVEKQDLALAAYRRSLAVDPGLVPALVNLANIHYDREERIEAQALYERAIRLDPQCFEAHFNLGHVFHDMGRYAEAQACYRQTIALNPAYPDAHFYLAVTLEKTGRSQDAKPHWRAYQQLAPDGEWVELAREFSE